MKLETPETRNCMLRNRFGGNSLGDKALDEIANLDVAVVCDVDAAFEAGAHLADVFFEAAQRSNLAFEDHHVVAQQAYLAVTLDGAILHVATGNSAHLGHAEGVAHL